MARRGLTLNPPRKDYSPHTPTARQKAFLDRTELEAFYGGAAGGGKSDALLMSQLRFAHIPQFSGLIVRRSFADLAQPGAIMDRAKSWLIPQGVEWSAQAKRFRFPSGATLTFGYLAHEEDVFQYQGAEFHQIGFDELTQFSEAQYTYLLSRIRRRADDETPLMARAAANPGGRGHEWVKARFVAPGDPSRPFVPAGVDDNPHLDVREYERSLSLLTPLLQKQLRHGDWDANPDGWIFAADRIEVGEPDSPALQSVFTMDLAATENGGDWTVLGHFLGLANKKTWVYELERLRKEPNAVRLAVIDFALNCLKTHPKTLACVLQDPGAAGKAQYAQIAQDLIRAGFPREQIRRDRPSVDKVTRAAGFAQEVNAKRVGMRDRPWNAEYRATLGAFREDGSHSFDDDVDVSSSADNALWREPGKAPDVPTKTNTLLDVLAAEDRLFESHA